MEQSIYETPCLIDIDRLQVYYDNVTDTLIGPAITLGSKHVILPVTWWFGHPFLIWGEGFTDLHSGTRLTEHLRFIYGLSEGCMVHLRSVGRLYGSITARQKVVRLILRAVSRTHSQLEVPFGRQHKRHLRRSFLCISCIFLLCFMVLLKQLRRLYTGGFIFQVPPVSD